MDRSRFGSLNGRSVVAAGISLAWPAVVKGSGHPLVGLGGGRGELDALLSTIRRSRRLF